MEHCKHPEVNIRNVVADNIGRLFIHYSFDMMDQIEAGLKSASPETRATIAKSFKQSAVKETESIQLEFASNGIIQLIKDNNLEVK